MKKYIINGGRDLSGEITVSGSKNVASKALVAACLTSEEVVLENIPLISDFFLMADIVRHIGGDVKIEGHRARIRLNKITNTTIPKDIAVKLRASSLFLALLLVIKGQAKIPSPGGDKIGARRIDMHIQGLEALGAKIVHEEKKGYFIATASGLKGCVFKFKKTTHMGTEAIMLAATLAKGRTVLENVALEPEVDQMIELLNKMGAKIERGKDKTIVIDGVKRLHGAVFSICPDRNEVVTLAIASSLLGGKVVIKNVDLSVLDSFLEKFSEAGGIWEEDNDSVRFSFDGEIKAVDISTAPYPGFMTDWQAPWAVLMTQANGVSVIHETIFEDRFQYVRELKKMGAKIELFNPKIDNPNAFYNFHVGDTSQQTRHAARIYGKTPLHGSDVVMHDLRAGATVVLASLVSKGKSVIAGIDQIERGYENFDVRFKKLGADIKIIV